VIIIDGKEPSLINANQSGDVKQNWSSLPYVHMYYVVNMYCCHFMHLLVGLLALVTAIILHDCLLCFALLLLFWNIKLESSGA